MKLKSTAILPATGRDKYHRITLLPEEEFAKPHTKGLPQFEFLDWDFGVRVRIGLHAEKKTKQAQKVFFDSAFFTKEGAVQWIADHLNLEFETETAGKEAKGAGMKIEKWLTIPITKIDKTTRMVEGYVTTESVDRDGQIVDLEMVKEAWPDYSRYGNIRRMHQPDVVGKMKDGYFDEKGLYVVSKVVDDAVWKGFEEGLYSGYSIGLANVRVVHDTKAPKGRITKKADGSMPFIPEISYVDRPSNPDADFMMVYKAADGKVEVAKIAPVGEEFWKDFDERLTKAAAMEQPPPEPSPADSPPPPPAPADPPPADPPPMPEATKELATFSTVWAAQNMANELPVMLDVLWRTILSIAYDGEATGASKKSALMKTMEEFAEKCEEYMTGKNLEAIRSEDLFKNAGAYLYQFSKTEEGMKKLMAGEIKKLAQKNTLELPEFLKGLTPEKLAAMEKAVSEVADLRAGNEKLEKRIKDIEDSPLPAKGIKVTDPAATGDTSKEKYDKLVAEAQSLGRSTSDIDRIAGEKLGMVILKVFGAQQ